MDNEKQEKIAQKPSSYGKAVSFLLLEILAIISFSLGSSFIFFAILAVVILGLTIVVTFRQIKLDGVASFGFFLFPILLFGLISILSYFKEDPTFLMYHSPFLFLVPLGLTCFAASGYFVNLTGAFKIRYALIVIYSGIALLTFINLFVTMIQFVPFYTIRYSDYYYYYDGSRSPESIGGMAYFLMNFSMVEVSLSYFSFYPMILLTAFLPLGFMKYKENKKLFLTYLGFGVLGLITIILTISKITLLMLFGVAVLIGLIAIFTKFEFNKKPLKIATAVVSGLFAFGVLFLFLNAQDSVGDNIASFRIGWLRDLTTGNSLLNRLFNANRFVSAYNSILDGLFTTVSSDGVSIMGKLFGFPIHGDYVYLFRVTTWQLKDSNSFFFDAFFSSGFFGVIFLVAVLVIGIRRMIKYYNNSDDAKQDKVLILGFIIISLAYALVNFDCTPMIFSNTVIPFYMNNIFFIILFLFGYCFFNSEKKKEEKVEEVINNEVQNA